MNAKFTAKLRSVSGVSPVISTVIITGTIVALLVVALFFANNFLWARLAESEFSSAKQFMQTIGLQVDDVAWTAGRTQTVRYSSNYGDVDFWPSTLTYNISITNSTGTYPLANYTVGIILFNMPASKFSMNNGYYELIYPSSNSNLTLRGASAPVTRVFVVENLTSGSFIRAVVAPSVRLLESNITIGSSTVHYVKLYLPKLVKGETPRRSQSVTLTGKSVSALTKNGITKIRIEVKFPLYSYDNTFFRFPSTVEEITIPSGYSDSAIEVYTGEVEVALGVHA